MHACKAQAIQAKACQTKIGSSRTSREPLYASLHTVSAAGYQGKINLYPEKSRSQAHSVPIDVQHAVVTRRRGHHHRSAVERVAQFNPQAGSFFQVIHVTGGRGISRMDSDKLHDATHDNVDALRLMALPAGRCSKG